MSCDHTHEHGGCGCGGCESHHDHDACESDHCGCHAHGASRRTELSSLVAAGLLLVGGFVAHALGASALASGLLHGLAIVSAGWLLVPGAWLALRQLRPNISLLMILAVAGACVIGDLAEAATVVFLFGVAEALEAWAEQRAHHAVEALLDLAPPTAWVRREGRLLEVLPTEVAIGEIVVVKSGERIPLDGEIVAGESAVDQSSITGESIPVDKRAGDAAFAGTINGSGVLELRVLKGASDTMLARIIRLVHEAEESRAPTQRFVDRFATIYTPAVTVLALLVFLLPPLALGGAWSLWLYRACVLLIIACPCALVIATPVGVVAGLTALARRGVLVKGGAHLESLGRITALAMDKTGTLTRGKPEVVAVHSAAGFDERQVLAAAAAVDAHSTHPLARAIVAHAEASGHPVAAATRHHSVAGRGAEAQLDGHIYVVGNLRFAEESGLQDSDLANVADAAERRGHTVVMVGRRPVDGREPGRLMGFIALGDRLRPEASDSVAALRAAGVRSIVVLSGDNQRTVDEIARQAGVDEARGELLPEAKAEAVAALRKQHGSVGMVGDGVNDAPALATATVGIAMGAAGSDAAIEAADVALMTDELPRIAEAIRLGRRTLAVIRFNIGFALVLKAAVLGLAVAGIASLWLAIVADTGATLLVVANALRLLRAGSGKK